jgi:hypothetical protein
LPFKNDYEPVTYQTPTPMLEIYLPNNTSSVDPDYVFRADLFAGAFSKYTLSSTILKSLK